MTSRTSWTYPVLLLRGDGTVEPLEGPHGPFEPTTVVLARERCLFERIDPAQGVKGAAAAVAARLQAQSGAPYQRAGTLLTRKGGTFGLWWWDAQWVGEKLGGAGLNPNCRIIPETMARTPGEGWRIAKATSGYEAQLWKDGFLVADVWKRTPFDSTSWAEFVHAQPDAQGASDAPPPAQSPAFALKNAYRRTQMSDQSSPEQTTQLATVGLAAALVCAGLWFGGQALGLQHATSQAQVEIDALKARLPASANVQAQVAGLTALRDASAGVDPMILLKSAQQILVPYNQKILAFEATRERIRIFLPAKAADDLRLISKDLTESSTFATVRPTLDAKRGRLILDLTPSVKVAPKKPVSAPAAPVAPTAAGPRINGVQ